MNIYPSILENSCEDFFAHLKTLSRIFNYFQIDIADGVFVDNKTVTLEEISQKLANQNIDFLKNKLFEFHLMTLDYQKDIQMLKKLLTYIPISRVFVHISVISEPHPVSCRDFEIGIALNPEDSIEEYWINIQKYTSVLLMTVHPGKQGSGFLPNVLNKIDVLREKGFSGRIILDGGINDKTIPLILKRANRPDAVCPGSYFKENPAIRLKKLQEILSKQ